MPLATTWTTGTAGLVAATAIARTGIGTTTATAGGLAGATALGRTGAARRRHAGNGVHALGHVPAAEGGRILVVHARRLGVAAAAAGAPALAARSLAAGGGGAVAVVVVARGAARAAGLAALLALAGRAAAAAARLLAQVVEAAQFARLFLEHGAIDVGGLLSVLADADLGGARAALADHRLQGQRRRAVLQAKLLAQALDLGLRQLLAMAALEHARQDDVAVAHALEAADLVALRFPHPPHFAVAALVQHHPEPGVRVGAADALDLVKLRRAVLQLD